ncbi:sensor histidine kinase [Tenacibaculum sp. M341]|uniref:sensor histidine kinase n=1 Tax=Tenacibaculum sp. M341 TaxID=2530339 RepID=UPI001050179F|nr:sensor histidine kinase [Tenacibaculum sp. M341]TCI85519.1 histidine kinase [Tenacibaculum sp. M341]
MVSFKSIIKTLGILTIHILFWIGVYFFYTYFLGYGTSNIAYVNKFSLFLMPITICISYFFLYFLIPRYLLQKKLGLFFLYTVYTFIISSFFIVLSILYGIVFCHHLTTNNASPLTKTLPFIIFSVYFIVLVVIILGLLIHNYKSTIKNEDLKNKFLKTQLQLKEQELRFLKMQIHPHFLFNTLNTLYGFALKKSDTAPEMILKLSNLLDYILYQVEKPFVLLKNEIQHIEDYITLEKMRFHDTLDVFLNDQTPNKDIEIAPMLLIPFIENSFKHGTIINGKLTVKINISLIDNLLIFSVQNTFKKTHKTSEGIGLENIKKRLNIVYPSPAHSLSITNDNDVFKILLKVQTDQLKSIKNGH